MSEPLRLFAVMVGGDHPKACVELHDVRFVAAASIEACFPALRAAWWGTPSSLHVDAYAEITRVGGHRVTPAPREAIPRSGPKLFFVNTGGYHAGVFAEQHRYSFHVHTDKKDAWAAARSNARDYLQPHKDNLEAVDDVLEVDALLSPARFGLLLTPEPGPDLVSIVAKYIKPPSED